MEKKTSQSSTSGWILASKKVNKSPALRAGCSGSATRRCASTGTWGSKCCTSCSELLLRWMDQTRVNPMVLPGHLTMLRWGAGFPHWGAGRAGFCGRLRVSIRLVLLNPSSHLIVPPAAGIPHEGGPKPRLCVGLPVDLPVAQVFGSNPFNRWAGGSK